MSTMRCKCRRQAETGLRCTRCNVPICPDCSRNAPVGFLCRTCAGGRRDSPLYQVSLQGLALGTLGCLTTGVFGGWIMAAYGYQNGLFGGFLAFVYGIVVAEVGLRITGRKRGLQMEIMTGTCAALGLIGGLLIELLTTPLQHTQDGDVIPLATAMNDAFMYPMFYLFIAVAIYGAISRVRNI